jgi:hypothetical protein
MGRRDDNELYRAWGCDALVLRSNDKMIEGLYTVVIRISGNKDPMNDDDATLEIGYSPAQIMKDARGNAGSDYSYRILQSAQYTKLKAPVKDGVVETEQADIHMPQIAWFYNQQRDAFFRLGKIQVVPNSGGTATGLVGGYPRPAGGAARKRRTEICRRHCNRARRRYHPSQVGDGL